MPTKIKVNPERAYQEKLVTLNGKSLYFTIAYNTSDDLLNNGDGAWYLDIADRNKVEIISGIKVLPIQNLTSRYLQVHKLLGGDLWCMNVKDSSAEITRTNFGTDSQFQLWYLSNEEMVQYGVA